MKWGRVAFALALVALFFYFKWPSASTVVGDTWVVPDEGRLEYQDVAYQAEWGSEVTYRGSARLFERAKYKLAPFFTHHTALATEEYADPDLVEIVHQGGGNFFWTAPRKPEGTLVVLHMIPLNGDVLDQLEEIDDGDGVKLVGRHESDSRIDGPDGMFIRLNHSNHKYLLVESATLLPD